MTEFYKANARKAVLKRKDNTIKAMHYRRKRKLVDLLNDYAAAKGALREVDKQTIIAMEIATTTLASFCRHGDRNNLEPSMILHYIRKVGTPLDVQSKDITEQYGIEITEDDLYEFMLEHPCGRTGFYKFQELAIVKEAIKEITGFNVTADFISYLKNKLEPRGNTPTPF